MMSIPMHDVYMYLFEYYIPWLYMLNECFYEIQLWLDPYAKDSFQDLAAASNPHCGWSNFLMKHIDSGPCKTTVPVTIVA